jgi:hypothetical protein
VKISIFKPSKNTLIISIPMKNREEMQERASIMLPTTVSLKYPNEKFFDEVSLNCKMKAKT